MMYQRTVLSQTRFFSNYLKTPVRSHVTNHTKIIKYRKENFAGIASLSNVKSSSLFYHCAIPTLVLTVGSNASLCDDGSEDDFLTKMKNIAETAKDEGGSYDWNKVMDLAATEVGAKATDIISTGVPGELSYGFVCGFCSGFAMKKIGRAGALSFGLLFCLLQTLSYGGYITIEYDRLEKEVTNALDVNNDGKIDQDDAKEIMDKIMEVMSFNLPAGSGFGVGFLGGVRAG